MGKHDGGAGQHQDHDGAVGHGAGTSAEVWDEMYRSRQRVWSGRPNPQLVAEAADLPPGTALDLGCGEGADALWLAQHDWTVTAVDVSAVALERAAAHAAAALGVQNNDGGNRHRAAGASGRIEWVHADLATWTPDRTFDLVTAQYLHSTGLPWQQALSSAADAVALGGALLIVGHHPDCLPPWGNHASKGMFYTAEELADELGIAGPGWQLDVLERRDRKVTAPDGREATVGDSVLRATRLS